MENVLLNVFVKRQMKLEQMKVAQNMQKLFIYVTSLKLSEFEDFAYYECFFISNEMFSPYHSIEKNQ